MASSILSKRPDLYQSVADWNSYSKPKESRKARSRALLAAPKLGCSLLNGSGTAVSGLPRCGASISLLGTLSGTLRSPSMSSEKQNSRVGTSLRPLEGLAHHGGAHDLAERADMRQARRAVAGLEQHIALGRRFAADAGDELAGFFERPRARGLGEGTIDLGHGSAKLGAAAICVNAASGPKCRAHNEQKPPHAGVRRPSGDGRRHRHRPLRLHADPAADGRGAVAHQGPGRPDRLGQLRRLPRRRAAGGGAPARLAPRLAAGCASRSMRSVWRRWAVTTSLALFLLAAAGRRHRQRLHA